ncbi:MAG: multiheme c-type cytochrome [Acidobacteriota bacterium]
MRSMRFLQHWVCPVGSVLLVCLWQPLAQEFDTVISSQNRKAYTILDQVGDPTERRALNQLFAENRLKQRAELADEFLKTYPRSWFLAQVNELAAKAWIDLGDLQKALERGRLSLKLLPENPLLLVPLANVQVQMSQLDDARESARQALDYLDRFAAPLSIPSGDWPAIHRQLKASCYFVLGRAAITDALSLPTGEQQARLLQDSEKFLLEARSLNPADAEIIYLLGLTQLSTGRSDQAAVNFAAAYSKDGPLSRQALEQLKQIHRSTRDGRETDLPNFLAMVSRQARQHAHEVLTPRSPEEPPAAGQQRGEYAGSESCRQCHADQHQNWQQTGMARMFRPYDPRNIIGDFGSEEPFFAGDQVRWDEGRLLLLPGPDRFPYARMIKDRGRHYFQIKQLNGRWVRYPVDYTIGSKWQQAYATRLPNGQIHVFPVQYNVLHKRWLNFWEVIDPEDSPRSDVRTFETFSAITSYQANCAVCHTSQLRNTQGRGFEADHLEFREAGINCEMCHGPSARHVGAMRKGKPYSKSASEPPVDFTKISSQEYLAICGQCHRQSALRDPGPRGELNYSGHTPFFYPSNKSRPYGEFSRKAFYKDGRFRETTFIVEALQRSACYRKGQAHCGHCHDVHGKDAGDNPKSLRFTRDPDRMCTQCHVTPTLRTHRHTGHPVDSVASRCVSCHMPAIMSSLLFRARTHQIDDTPSIETVQHFGLSESPNACLQCHQEKNVEWLQDSLTAWTR